MKVKELIQELQEFSPNAEVVFDYDGFFYVATAFDEVSNSTAKCADKNLIITNEESLQ